MGRLRPGHGFSLPLLNTQFDCSFSRGKRRMLRAYQQQNGGLKAVTIGEEDTIPPSAIWLDLLNPTLEERRKVDRALGLEMPTRADMEEIEISSRLYQEDSTLFMTAMIMAQADTDLRPPMRSPSCRPRINSSPSATSIRSLSALSPCVASARWSMPVAPTSC